jgi:hypothetical protein
MIRTASIQMDRAAKDFKIEYDTDFIEWIHKIEGYSITIKENNLFDFPEPVRFCISQIITGCHLHVRDYDYLTLSIYTPSKKSSSASNTIEAAENGVLDRVISVFGSREFFMLQPKINCGRASIPKKMLLPGNCCHFFNGSGCAFNITFDDESRSVLPPRKGFRSGIFEKKNPSKRFVVVLDIYPNDERLSKTLSKLHDAVTPKEKQEEILDDLM